MSEPDLFDRFEGVNGAAKIALHPFCAMVSEYKRGAVTFAEIVEVFALTTYQAQQLAEMYGLIGAAVDRGVWKDVLYLYEGRRADDRTQRIYDRDRVKARLGMT